MKKSILYVLVPFVSLVTILAVIELAGRFFGLPPKAPDPVGWYTWTGVDHFSELPHASEVNEFGTRGQPIDPERTKTVILLGDSQVETSHVKALMPERLLRDRLDEISGERYNVVSLGSWGWGNLQELNILERTIAKIRPQYVVLWFTTNDFADNLSARGFNGLRTYAEMGRSTININVVQPLDRVYVTRLVGSLLSRAAKRYRRDSPFPSCMVQSDHGKLWSRESILEAQSAFSEEVDYERVHSQVPFASGNRSPEVLSLEDAKLKYVRDALASWFVGSRPIGGSAWGDTLPNDRFALQNGSSAIHLGQYKVTRNILERIQALSNSYGATFLLFYSQKEESSKFRTSQPLRLCVGDSVISYTNQAFDSLMNSTLENIENVLAVNGRDPADENGSRDYFDGHLSTSANRRVVKQIAAWIVAHPGRR